MSCPGFIPWHNCAHKVGTSLRRAVLCTHQQWDEENPAWHVLCTLAQLTQMSSAQEPLLASSVLSWKYRRGLTALKESKQSLTWCNWVNFHLGMSWGFLCDWRDRLKLLCLICPSCHDQDASLNMDLTPEDDVLPKQLINFHIQCVCVDGMSQRNWVQSSPLSSQVILRPSLWWAGDGF